MKKLIACIIAAVFLLALLPSASAAGTRPGDVNCDGWIDAGDLTALARHIARISVIGKAEGLANADMDQDGAVDARDLSKLAGFIPDANAKKDIKAAEAAANAYAASLGFIVDTSMTPSNSSYYPPAERDINITQSQLVKYAYNAVTSLVLMADYDEMPYNMVRINIVIEEHGEYYWVYALYG